MEDKQFVLDFSQSRTEYYGDTQTVIYKFFSDKVPEYSNNIFSLYDSPYQYCLGVGLYFNKYEDLDEYDIDNLYEIQIRVIWKNLDESIFFLNGCTASINWGRQRINFVAVDVFKNSVDKEEYEDLIKSIKYLQEHLMDIETVLVNIKEIILDDGEDEG